NDLLQILFDQAQRSVKQQLHNFVKDDVRKFKETKKQFDRVREDMEIAQVKNAQAPRNKPHEAEEATSALICSRKSFRHLALDYINVLQAKKKFEILDSMLSFMQAQYSLFQQGFNLLDEIHPYMKKLAAELDQLVIESAMEKREMEHKHATIQQRCEQAAVIPEELDLSRLSFPLGVLSPPQAASVAPLSFMLNLIVAPLRLLFPFLTISLVQSAGISLFISI
ncbi:hypothetical protein DNTS_034918, partial [Danionella cerebrum]